MSLFSSIGSALTKATDFLGITTKAQTGSPITSNSPTYGASVLNPSFVKTATQAAGAALLGTPAVASKLLSIAGSTAVSAGNLAKNVFTSLTPIKQVAVIAATPVVGLTVAKSSNLQKAILNTPAAVNKLTSDVASFADNPSLQTAKDIYEGNPFIVTAAGVAGAIALGSGVSNLMSNWATNKNTKAMNENTQAMKQSPVMPTTSDLVSSPSAVSMQPSDLSPSKSLTPAPSDAPTASLVAQPVKSITRTKRRKRKSLPRYEQRLQPQVLNRITIGVGVHG
jgi:hypothetical protein